VAKPIRAATRLKGIRFDASSIVANTDAKQAIVVPNFSLDVACACVVESVTQ
jgi:hypothetical protein